MAKTEKKKLHIALRILRGVGIALGVVVLIAGGYLLYAFASYYRVEDYQKLTVVSEKNTGAVSDSPLKLEKLYTIVSYNVGFGAYSPDFSFFMDGGEKSWAESPDSVNTLLNGAGNLLLSLHPDFILMQEVDVDATRSYHIDQRELMAGILSDYSYIYAQDWDSPFLFWPLTEPHGATKAGLVTYSRYKLLSGLRRSFPVSDGFSKMLDLDRCLSITRVGVENGKELVLINLHMSAYGNSDEVRDGQANLIAEVLSQEYAKGNYVIAGGDFNHDLKDMGSVTEERDGWAYPYERGLLPEHFSFALDKEGCDIAWNSCRDAGKPYGEDDETYTLDGFIISDNVTMNTYVNFRTGYAFSDHDPVVMTFVLED